MLFIEVLIAYSDIYIELILYMRGQQAEGMTIYVTSLQW
jgi:hypothetical protein